MASVLTTTKHSWQIDKGALGRPFSSSTLLKSLPQPAAAIAMLLPIKRMLQILRTIGTHRLLLGDCLLCRQSSQTHPLICDECQADLPRIPFPCPSCAFPLAEPGIRCGACLQQPPAWDRLRVLADYETPYRQLIHRLKYQRHPECAVLLARLFSASLEQDERPEALLPVPLHWWRQWRRGYNQAAELAHAIGRLQHIPVDSHCLQRIRATPAQARLNKQQRQKNLREAFTLHPISYRHVAVVDDVVTTGATAEQLTLRLKAAGVERVEIWAICRTLRHRS